MLSMKSLKQWTRQASHAKVSQDSIIDVGRSKMNLFEVHQRGSTVASALNFGKAQLFGLGSGTSHPYWAGHKPKGQVKRGYLE